MPRCERQYSWTVAPQPGGGLTYDLVSKTLGPDSLSPQSHGLVLAGARGGCVDERLIALGGLMPPSCGLLTAHYIVGYKGPEGDEGDHDIHFNRSDCFESPEYEPLVLSPQPNRVLPRKEVPMKSPAVRYPHSVLLNKELEKQWAVYKRNNKDRSFNRLVNELLTDYLVAFQEELAVHKPGGTNGA